MRNHRTLAPGFVILAVILAYALSACTPAGFLEMMPEIALFQSGPQLGETVQRQRDGMTMVFVPSGEFMMGTEYDDFLYANQLCKNEVLSIVICDSFGNEMPAHPVRLDAFWVDLTEITNQQYQGCVEDSACSSPADSGSYTRETYFGDAAFADFPVIWVTRDQAAEYCSWAGGRLPSEAEWEYAARGPENNIFPWGDIFEPSYANYCDASCALGVSDPSYEDGYPETAPVGSFPAGASWCGALDMAGNVREWVADWFSGYSLEAQVNPVGPEEGRSHIPKGGCWLDRADNLRSANRGENTPDYVRHKVGFRCVKDYD
ncbi:MAG: formylglycine-generating enzyme family protein [Anaerolineales bacterium]